jgi:hypothetical protein
MEGKRSSETGVQENDILQDQVVEGGRGPAGPDDGEGRQHQPFLYAASLFSLAEWHQPVLWCQPQHDLPHPPPSPPLQQHLMAAMTLVESACKGTGCGRVGFPNRDRC